MGCLQAKERARAAQASDVSRRLSKLELEEAKNRSKLANAERLIAAEKQKRLMEEDAAAKVQARMRSQLGQGKTAVIMPLMCLLLADGNSLPVAVLPESLLSAGRAILQGAFSTIIHKKVSTLRGCAC